MRGWFYAIANKRLRFQHTKEKKEKQKQIVKRKRIALEIAL